MPEPVLDISGLGHAYGDTAVLSDVSLTVAPGELVSVLGHSGAGKTTLLRAIGGFVAPQTGRIVLGGKTVTDQGRIRIATEKRGLGIVFQDYALFSHMTVAANVGFGLPRGQSARVDEMLALVGLSELADRRPAQLSGGQQQRVALARALAPRPAMLLLDEPFANLDAALRHQLRDDLRDTLVRAETAALLITHDRTEALAIADRVAVLTPQPQGATIRQLDTPSQVYARPISQEVAALTGEVTAVAGTGQGEAAVTPLGTLPLESAATGAVTLLIRPEQLTLVPGDGAATVIARQFLGATVGLVVQQGDLKIRLEVAAHEAHPVGTSGTLNARQPLHAVG